MKRTVSIILILIILISAGACRRVGPAVIIPEKDVETDDFVRLAPGVAPEMTLPAYWIKDNSFADVILSADMIKKFNEDNGKLISTKSAGNFSLESIKSSLSGTVVKEIINSLKFPEDEQFINGLKVGSEYWLNLKENCNINAVPEKVDVKFGYGVVRDTLRQFPTDDYANVDYDDYFYDSFIMSDFMPFSPVAVLHTSADNEWYFVATYCCCGWIEQKNVAICPSREDWIDRMNPESFLVVTGRELRLSNDPYCPELSGLLLPMGTKLPLVKAENAPSSINQRYTFGCYVVKLPVRLSDGSISDFYSLIPSGSDVSVGYIPYTAGNVINLALKLQGDIYGWAGDFNSNDCSGIIREIFRCFGMEFPRVGGQQVNVTGLRKEDVSALDDAQKKDYISKLKPGSLLYFPGHIMIYLGLDEKGEPYALSSVGSIATPELNNGEVMQVNTVLIAGLIRTSRKTGATWLSSITKILESKPENV